MFREGFPGSLQVLQWERRSVNQTDENIHNLSKAVDSNSREKIIPWSLEKFANQRVIMTTGFGMEGCALINMYSKSMSQSEKWQGRKMPVVYLDTGFFFPETYALRDRMVEKYPNMEFVNRGTTLTPEEQERQYGKELWKHNPTLCCKLRKVDPMFPIMKETDVWITGLRRSQSVTRANIKVVEWDGRYKVLKVSPLAELERSDILEYVKANNVPYNPLHEQGYPTIGCTHCTIPVQVSKIGEYSRAGRWADYKMTDCGLHGGNDI